MHALGDFCVRHAEKDLADHDLSLTRRQLQQSVLQRVAFHPLDGGLFHPGKRRRLNLLVDAVGQVLLHGLALAQQIDAASPDADDKIAAKTVVPDPRRSVRMRDQTGEQVLHNVLGGMQIIQNARRLPQQHGIVLQVQVENQRIRVARILLCR